MNVLGGSQLFQFEVSGGVWQLVPSSGRKQIIIFKFIEVSSMFLWAQLTPNYRCPLLAFSPRGFDNVLYMGIPRGTYSCQLTILILLSD